MRKSSEITENHETRETSRTSQSCSSVYRLSKQTRRDKRRKIHLPTVVASSRTRYIEAKRERDTRREGQPAHDLSFTCSAHFGKFEFSQAYS